jgi:2,4-dienoyl-CoA reductase-like NADH-dependent reductase (Old Yellow Enzyme family)
MAPLTRNRATASTAAPNSLIAEYYEQRASDGGLLITEVSSSRNVNTSALTSVGNIPLGRSRRLPNHPRTVHPGTRQGVEKDD